MVLIYVDDWIPCNSEDSYSLVEFEYTLAVYNQQFLENIPDLDDVALGMYALDPFQSLKTAIADLLQLNSTNVKLVWNGVNLQDQDTPYSGLLKKILLLFIIISVSVGMSTANIQKEYICICLTD